MAGFEAERVWFGELSRSHVPSTDAPSTPTSSRVFQPKNPNTVSVPKADASRKSASPRVRLPDVPPDDVTKRIAESRIRGGARGSDFQFSMVHGLVLSVAALLAIALAYAWGRNEGEQSAISLNQTLAATRW